MRAEAGGGGGGERSGLSWLCSLDDDPHDRLTDLLSADPLAPCTLPDDLVASPPPPSVRWEAEEAEGLEASPASAATAA